MHNVMSVALTCVGSILNYGEVHTLPAGAPAPVVSRIISTLSFQPDHDIALAGKGSRGKKKKAPANPWPASNHGFKDPLAEVIFYGIGLVVVLAMLIYVIVNKIE